MTPGIWWPPDVWSYITAKVRDQFPDTVFLLEGLGSLPAEGERLRCDTELDWDYSELFHRLNGREVEGELTSCLSSSRSSCLLVHFVETHDSDRAAARGERFASMRTALSALCSSAGAWGITCGVEWFADEKISVHDRTALRPPDGSGSDQLASIRRLNALLASHPSFHAGARVELIHRGDGDCLALIRRAPTGDECAAGLDQPRRRQPRRSSLGHGRQP